MKNNSKSFKQYLITITLLTLLGVCIGLFVYGFKGSSKHIVNNQSTEISLNLTIDLIDRVKMSVKEYADEQGFTISEEDINNVNEMYLDRNTLTMAVANKYKIKVTISDTNEITDIVIGSLAD